MTAPQPDPYRLQADLVLLALTAAWGLTFVAVKDAVARVPVFTFLTMRFGLAALTLAVIVVLAGRRGSPTPATRGLGPGSTALAGLLTGGLLFLGYALQTVGLQFTTSSKAGFITGLSVVLVPMMDAVALRRRPDPFALTGVALAAGGMAVMFLEPAELAVRRGDLLVLGCAAAFGAHVTAVSHFGRLHDGVRYTLWQVVAVVALSSVAAPFEGWRGEGVDLALGGTLLLTGPLVSGVLLVAQVWGQRHTSATHAAVLFALEPLFAALGGVFLAQEPFGVKLALGGLLILLGMLVAEAGRWRLFWPAAPRCGTARGAPAKHWSGEDGRETKPLTW